MIASAKVAVRMSIRDFLDWESGDGLRYELVDGEPRAMAPASNAHGLLQSELSRRIGNHLLEHRAGCKVVIEPGVIPRLMSAHNFRVPDLGVTCSPIPLGQTVMPEPVLLIEILSPCNQAKTWSNVWAYTSIPSVQEILVLETTQIAADLLRRSPDGAWPEQTAEVRNGTLTLASIGLEIPLDQLYSVAGLSF